MNILPRKRKVKVDVLLPVDEVQVKCLQMMDEFIEKLNSGFPILTTCFGSINVSKLGTKSLLVRLSQGTSKYMVCFELRDLSSGKKINFNRIYKKEDMKLSYLQDLKDLLCFEFRE